MKDIIKYLLLCIISLGFFSCDYLDLVPDNVATIDYAFRDRVGAEKYLFTCYSYLPNIGNPASDPTIMASDEWWAHEDSYYYQYTGNFNSFNIKRGQQNPNSPLLNYWEGSNNGRGLFAAIRDCNVFLENIRSVGPDLADNERTRYAAEVKFLKAYYHYYLLRMYGPIPLIKENSPVFSTTDEVRPYRDTFDDCLNYIVQLIDEAVPDLPEIILDANNEMGRITQSIALSVKAEALVMAASPLFNGNNDYADLVDDRGINLFSTTEDPSKWTVAAQACKAAIVAVEATKRFSLYKFTYQSYELTDSSRLCMTLRAVVTDKWNSEIIWGNTQNASQAYSRLTIPYFTAEFRSNGGGDYQPMLCPSFRMAELFYTNKGVPIEEDNSYDYANRYETVMTDESHKYYIQSGFETVKLHMNREPRFYANLGFDGGYWHGNGRIKDVGKGTSSEQPWPLRMKLGEASGKTGGLRYSMTGYWAKKPGHFETTTSSTGATTVVRTCFPIMRLSDLYLLYAEALNESLAAPTAEVYQYVDSVRIHAGLEGVVDSWQKYSKVGSKPATKDGMREIIHQERMIELAFEGKRFWDIRRWKKATDYMNQPVRGWNIDGQIASDFYNVVTIYPLEFSNKEYLWPISQSELRTNNKLVQNLGW